MWGTSHRYYGSVATRVPFDRVELEYLQALFVSNPHYMTSGKTAAMTLAHIRRDRAARAIFHERHVMNTTRLKAGFAALEKAKAAAHAGDPWGGDGDDDDGDGDGDGDGDNDDNDGNAGTEDSSPPTTGNDNNRLRFFND